MPKRGSRRYRTEQDYLGKKKIPVKAFYGVQTQRALENFPISGITMPLSLVYALAMIKKSAALANISEQRLDSKKGRAIIRACQDILHGRLDDQFPLDIYQAGAGTSEHMNVNEVIANRALQILGKKRGLYTFVHPHDHVNLGQSTNDVFHSATQVAVYLEVRDHLLPVLKRLEQELKKKAVKWKRVVKSGRTHLRDAVPMTLGQEFRGFADTITKDRKHIEDTYTILLELNLGGTAIGTKINTSKGYQRKAFRELKKLTKAPFRPSQDLFEGTQSLDSLMATSSALKVLASDLIKIANDLRLLSSGPATGLNEIELPAVQPGSSIMPGKVNPVIAEMMDMVGFQVIANDMAITLCGQAGQLELNVMAPLAAYSLLHSVHILGNSVDIFTSKCIKGIKAHPEKAKAFLEKNPIIVTALTPYLGYNKAAQVAKLSYTHDKPIKDIVLQMRLMDKTTLDNVLNVNTLAKQR
jgi:fumarate hydratase, class II